MGLAIALSSVSETPQSVSWSLTADKRFSDRRQLGVADFPDTTFDFQVTKGRVW